MIEASPVVQFPGGHTEGAQGGGRAAALRCVSILTLAVVSSVVLLGLWFRIPRISEGLPFFYQEDEAHHFNRSVNMVKSGEWNPRYFHKPSLHFYLRMPVVALSFLWGVKEGHLRSLKEIQTHDKYGLAGYAFTASHPGVVKWNRALSVVFSLLVIGLTFLLVRQIGGNIIPAGFAALLVAVSPAMVAHSAVIGVDMLMTLMCVSTISIALALINKFSFRGLVLLGVVSGLAVSSKYNALPIMAMPLIVCAVTRRFAVKELIAAVVTPILGFFLGSPFILASLPLFLDQLAYEIWHYGISGHEGHSAEPGIAQALFYLNWLSSDALGITTLILALIGLPILAIKSASRLLVILAFPATYFLLMSMQRANFERNMLVVIPFLSVFAGAALSAVFSYLLKSMKGTLAVVAGLALVLLSIYGSVGQSIAERKEVISWRDSRTEAGEWLKENSASLGDIALAGQLMFPADVLGISGAGEIDIAKLDPFTLYQEGYDTLVASPLSADSSLAGIDVFTVLQSFDGVHNPPRVVKDPAIKVYGLKKEVFGAESMLAWIKTHAPIGYASVKAQGFGALAAPELSPCEPSTALLRGEGEDYCWLGMRYTVVKLRNIDELRSRVDASGKLFINLSLLSPWKEQEATFSAGSWRQTIKLGQQTNAWQDFTLEIPYQLLRKEEGLLVFVSHVHAPKARGAGSDERRLGLAFRGLELK